MLNIIFPLAGSSEPFKKAGYIYPKPLIELNGTPMIERVLENPKQINEEVRIFFIVKEEDCNKFHLDNTLKLLSENATIIKLKKDTSGALCSLLMAIDVLPKDEELLVLNSDQIISMDFNDPLKYFRSLKSDTGVVTFPSIHPRWSYALVQENNVIPTAEKNPISKNAIAGFYYFKKCETFFKMAFKTIRKNASTDGMFFTSSVINEYILANKKAHIFPLEKEQYISFYSPQMINEYELMNSKR